MPQCYVSLYMCTNSPDEALLSQWWQLKVAQTPLLASIASAIAHRQSMLTGRVVQIVALFRCTAQSAFHWHELYGIKLARGLGSLGSSKGTLPLVVALLPNLSSCFVAINDLSTLTAVRVLEIAVSLLRCTMYGLGYTRPAICNETTIIL